MVKGRTSSFSKAGEGRRVYRLLQEPILIGLELPASKASHSARSADPLGLTAIRLQSSRVCTIHGRINVALHLL
ncbi:MAG: hypothetical protein C4293_18665 [Nitrospiraceae bacterium]